MAMAENLNPDENFANEGPFNLPTDPVTYPVFEDFGERYMYIVSQLTDAYGGEVFGLLTDRMNEDDNLQQRIYDEVEAWSRRNNFEDLEFKLFQKNRGDHDNENSSDDGGQAESESDEYKDEDDNDNGDKTAQMDYINQVREADPERIRRAIRNATHLPVPPRSGITRNSIYNQPPVYHVPAVVPSDDFVDFGPGKPRRSPSGRGSSTSSSRDRSPERIRGRRGSEGGSSDGSGGHNRRDRRATRREKFPIEYAETRSERGSTTNSPGGRMARSGSSHQERSPRGGTPNSSREGGGSPTKSGSNSPGRADSSGRGAVVWSDSEESVNSRHIDMVNESRTAQTGGRRTTQTIRRGGGGRQMARRGGLRRNAGRRARSPDIAEVGSHNPGPRSQDQEDELRTRAFLILSRAERDRRFESLVRKLNITFVGELCIEKFQPSRGDLIISHPNTGSDSRYIGLPNSVGYIASYLGDKCRFTEGRDLVLRVGSFDTSPNSRPNSQPVYNPFGSLELYGYQKVSGKVWTFHGHQAKLQNGIFRSPPDTSPGKFLKVGTPVFAPSSTFVQALVPRRGDVIIRREVWTRGFTNDKDFWYSMVKWHKGRTFSFLLGDMLVRRLVDNDGGNRSWGWAELYQYGGPSMGWVFWGRTQHVYDTPWPSERESCDVLYEYDHGSDSEEEIQKERVHTRQDLREIYQDGEQMRRWYHDDNDEYLDDG